MATLPIDQISFRVIPCPYMPIKGWVQSRTHRKKRINKKWLKRYGERPVYEDLIFYRIGENLYMSNGMYKKLMKQIKGLDPGLTELTTCIPSGNPFHFNSEE